MPNGRPALAIALLIILTAGCVSPTATEPDESSGAAPKAGGPGGGVRSGPTFAAIMATAPAALLDATLAGSDLTLGIHVIGDAEAITGHILDFGDGTPPREGRGPPPTRAAHAYDPPLEPAQAVDYTIRVTLIVPTAGPQVTATTRVTVGPIRDLAPSVALTAQPATTAASVPVLLRPVALDPEGGPLRWSLDFGDGTPALDGRGPPPAVAHAYARLGSYVARLTAHDSASGRGVATTTIQVGVPSDLVLWTFDGGAHTLAAETPMDAVALRLETRRPHCGEAWTCETPRALLSRNGTLHVVLDRPQANGMVWMVDAATGATVRNVTILPHPADATVDATGALWIAHRSGTLARILPGAPAATFFPPAIADDGHRLLILDPGRHRLWVVEDTTPARVLVVDTQTGAAIGVPFALPSPPIAAASAGLGQLAVLDAAGRVHRLAANEHGVTALAAAAAGPDGVPTALTCDTARGRCYAAYSAANPAAPAWVVTLDDGAALSLPTFHTELPAGAATSSLTLAGGRLVASLDAANGGPHGLVFVDAETGAIVHDGSVRVGRVASTAPVADPVRAHYAWWPDAATGTWWLIDLDSGQYHAVGPVTLGTVDGALAHALGR